MKNNLDEALTVIEEYKTEDIAHIYNVVKNNNTNKLDFCIGEENNKLFNLSLNKEEHLLICGEHNTGKSTLVHSILIQLILKNDVNELSLWIIDPKTIEFDHYSESGHCRKIVTEYEETTNLLQDALIEINNREILFKNSNCNNIEEYNNLNENKLPHIIIVDDELFDLQFHDCDEDVENIKKMINKKGLGIHLIALTQRVDFICESVIKEFDNIICFNSTIERSEILLGNEEAISLDNQFIYKKDKCIILNNIYLDQKMIFNIYEKLFL